MGQVIVFLCEVSREAPKPSHKERLGIFWHRSTAEKPSYLGSEGDRHFLQLPRERFLLSWRPAPFQVSIQPLTHPFLTAEPSSVPILTGSFLMGPASLSAMPCLSPALSSQEPVSSHLYLEGAVQTSGMLRRRCEK